VSARSFVVGAMLAGLSACSRPAAPSKPEHATAPPPRYEAELGHDVFAHYCATCHGDTGAGDGFNAYNLDPRPRDLSDPDLQKKRTDAELADTIRRGGAGVGLSNLMPPWGRTLTDRQIGEVVLYVRGLKKTTP
jgi:mono/diheme cytochrome c family protein